MTQPSPQTIADDLIERINELWHQKNETGKYNDIEFQKIKHEIDKLYNVNYTLAYTTQAMLYCVAENERSAREFHEKAIYESNKDPDIIGHYVTTLINLGHYREAIDLGETIYKDKLHDKDFIKDLILLAERVCDEEKFTKYIEFYNKNFEEQFEYLFPEDDEETLDGIMTTIEENIESNPEKLYEADEQEFQEMLKLAKEIEDKS